MLVILFIVFFACMFFGVPVAFSMGIGALSSFLFGNASFLAIFTQRLWGGLDSFPLMAVPLFILAGVLMEEGGVSRRLVNFANALVGWMRGGLGMVSVVSSMIFAGISGSGSADASAIGSIMIPPMVQKGYDKGFVASIVAAGAVIGPIIPPSILMVLYCTVTGISVGAAFLSGVIPGIIMGLCLMVVVYLYARKNPHVDNDTFGVKVSFKEFFQITKSASFALSVPLVIIGGIVLGIFTATEAAAVAIFLAFFGGLFLYKELKLSRIVKILADAARVSSGIMMVVGMAATISWVLSVNQFPLALVNFISSLTDSPRMIILLVIALLVFLGTFIDSPAVVLIFVPVLAPLTAKYGINEVHFAIVCVMTIHIGAITPPVGMLLYISSSMTGIRLSQTFRHLLPCFLALMVATLITALLPEIPLFLPKLFNLIE